MEQDEQLKRILHELNDKWDKQSHSPDEEIKKALKRAIHLRVGGYDATIEQFEKNCGNRGRAYKRLSVDQQIALDKMYEKKINEIDLFIHSPCAVMLKDRYRVFWPNTDSWIVEALIEPNELGPSALENKKYFEAIGEELSKYEYTWIFPLYNYYLKKIENETPITLELLAEKVEKEILKPKTVEEWAKFFRTGEFIALAKWVENFIRSINDQMIDKSKARITWLQNRINPKFYLLKTDKDKAFVFNEYGSLYVFVKGGTSILYEPEEYKSFFYDIKKENSTAFPEFHPEEW